MILNLIHLLRTPHQVLFLQHLSHLLVQFNYHRFLLLFTSNNQSIYLLFFHLLLCLHLISVHPILNKTIFNRFLLRYSILLNNNNSSKYHFYSIRMLFQHHIPIVIHTSMMVVDTVTVMIIS